MLLYFREMSQLPETHPEMYKGFMYFIIIIFISSCYKLVKNTNKNQPSSIYNFIFYATLRTKKM